MACVRVRDHQPGDHLGVGVDLEGAVAQDLEGDVAVVVGGDGERGEVVAVDQLDLVKVLAENVLVVSVKAFFK